VTAKEIARSYAELLDYNAQLLLELHRAEKEIEAMKYRITELESKVHNLQWELSLEKETHGK
jgi:cytoskeletal protein RodZ